MSSAQSSLRPQDIVILLRILTWPADTVWRHLDIARDLGLSQAEISLSLERCRRAQFLSEDKKTVFRNNLLEFIIHWLKYVYPGQMSGSMVSGVPTAHSASPLKEHIVSEVAYVWPSAEGTVRGTGIIPFSNTVLNGARCDARLYEMLALIEALRVGRARERNMAADELKQRILAA